MTLNDAYSRFIEAEKQAKKRETEPQVATKDHDLTKYASLRELLEMGDHFTLNGHRFIAGGTKSGNFEMDATLLGGTFPLLVVLSAGQTPDTIPQRAAEAYIARESKKRRKKREELLKELAELGDD